ncbi:MAG: Xaa-Pro peptidase family protein [Chloroflexota bacterium]|nr:Xaa-Pro peptidase family protein [Chloroflexota bacterium]
MSLATVTDYTRRVENVRETLREKELDGVLVLGPANRRYLTGFTGRDGQIGESAGIVLVTRDRAVLVASPLYSEQARAEGVGVEVLELRERWYKALPEHLTEWGVRRLGFERDYTLYGHYEDLKERMPVGSELLPLKGVVEEMRVRKSSAELEVLRAAARIADEAYARVVGSLRPGVTEKAVARALDEAMEELGAEGPSFPTIVAAGPNSARPHHESGDTVIQQGDPVVIDMGARYEGYCSDMTRSFSLGRADDRYLELHGLVLQAHLSSQGAIRPGLSAKDADAVARDLLKAAGYEQEFSHSLGHGVGMDVHEPPRLHKDSEDTLDAGMVVTVEPGVYITGYGGVRIEDTVVVTDTGHEALNHSPKKEPVI